MRQLALLMLVPALLRAQNISCALSGMVQDPGGAVIAGVKVTLTGEDNGFARSAITTGEGYFSFKDLTPATFTLSIEAPGFKRYKQTGIAMTSSEQRSLGRIPLQIGDVAEAVSVSAEIASVNLATGEKSGTLTGDELEHIALRGRDIFDAISLLPGVVDTSDGRDAPGPTSIGNIYVMGGRNDSKNMTIDGVTNLDTGSNGSVHSMPSMDSVAEVKLLSSNYSAEHGRNPSAVTIITKGGGRQFHGTASWFYRHEDLNANDFFSNQAGRGRSPYRFNIAVYTIGGPIVIPKAPTLRNRLFFFFNQEFQQKQVQYGTKTITVPTALERSGDFSKSLNVNGARITVNDPLNGKKAFPGNIIPESRLTETGRNILNMFPLPNYVDPNPTRVNSWNYFSAASGGYPRRTETGRVDFSPNDHWQLYTRLQNNADNQHTPYGIWVDGSLNFPLTPIVFNQPGRGAVLNSTNTITPSLINVLVLGVSQNTLTFYPEDPAKVDRAKLGIDIPQRNPSLNPDNIIPDMTFGGNVPNAVNPSLNAGTPYFNRNNIFSVVDNLSRIAGTHSLKGGLYFERTQKFQSASSLTRGSLSFNNDGNNALDSNDAFANALLGNYDTYAEANARPQGSYLFTNLELYIQDTWRARRNLSLDYGVRVYHDPAQYDTRRQIASFSPALYSAAAAPVLLRPATVGGTKVALDPRNGAAYPSGLIGAYAPGSGDPANGSYVGGVNGYPAGLYTVPALSFAPRIGFAWDPLGDGRTSIRGGGGVFFDRIEGNPTMGQIANPPTIYTPTSYYGSFADIAVNATSGLLAPTGSITSLAGKGQVQSIYNFSLSVQRQFGRATLAEVSYAGSLGRHLLWQRNINPVPIGAGFLNIHPENRDPTTTNSPLPPNFLRPYQGLGDVFLYEFATSSNYHSLQSSLSQRFSHGVSFGLSYTFSKALDTSDSYSQAVDPFLDPRSRNYGPAGFDRPHVFSARYTWQLPRRFLGRWELSGVTRMLSGAPFTPGYSLVSSPANVSGSPSETIRVIDAHPDAPPVDRFGPPTIGTAQPPSPVFGNVGKNVLRQPGTNNFDMSLYKQVKVTERLSGQLRFETYNTFNHTQFSALDTSAKFDIKGAQINPLFLQPTTARPPRILQLALKLVW